MQMSSSGARTSAFIFYSSEKRQRTTRGRSAGSAEAVSPPLAHVNGKNTAHEKAGSVGF